MNGVPLLAPSGTFHWDPTPCLRSPGYILTAPIDTPPDSHRPAADNDTFYSPREAEQMATQETAASHSTACTRLKGEQRALVIRRVKLPQLPAAGSVLLALEVRALLLTRQVNSSRSKSAGRCGRTCIKNEAPIESVPVASVGHALGTPRLEETVSPAGGGNVLERFAVLVVVPVHVA